MIQGINVRLRPFNLSDAVFIAEMKNDPEGFKAFAGSPFPGNLESEKEWISHMYPPGLRSVVYFAVEEMDSGTFVGYCVARNINYINRNAEMGIIFSRQARGKGYYKEVSFLFYNYLFSQLNLHKLYSLVIKTNFSLKTDWEIGYVEEGIVKEHIWQDGEYKDMVFVSLFRDAFYKIWEKGLSNFIKRVDTN
jgi:RimJ/RimL family protein N-acetyltransferase